MTAPRDDDPRRVDAYLDALLTAREPLLSTPESRAASPAPPAILPSLDDPGLEAAATALHTSLVRFHPSFRFEDRLAARLRSAAQGEPWSPSAATPKAPVTQPALATIIIFPHAAGSRTGAESEVADAADADHARGLLLGGAIASGVSIAGAALYAWHRQRTGRSRTGIA